MEIEKKTAECTIIIPTHSSYFDVCENFISVLQLSWKDCPYPVVVSACGRERPFGMAPLLYNGEKATLPDCLVNAVKAYPSMYYLVFLGDAFMCGQVENKKVGELIATLLENEIEYCSLKLARTLIPKQQISPMLRKIHVRDRYNHTFICFAASPDFMLSEFTDPAVRTDLDFEMKYLERVNDSKEEYYYDKHAIITEDIFHICPGIEKGVWDRKVLSWLKKNYPTIEYSNRKCCGIMHQLYTNVLLALRPFMPKVLRRFLKRTLGKWGMGKLYFTDT